MRIIWKVAADLTYCIIPSLPVGLRTIMKYLSQDMWSLCRELNQGTPVCIWSLNNGFQANGDDTIYRGIL